MGEHLKLPMPASPSLDETTSHSTKLPKTAAKSLATPERGRQGLMERLAIRSARQKTLGKSLVIATRVLS